MLSGRGRAALEESPAQTNADPEDTMPPPLPDNMPRVIAVGGLKGGIGKSTLAMFIALVFAIIYRKRVLFVDADPASQTGWDWWKLARAAGKPLPLDIETWPHAQVGDMVCDRTPGKYDVVVIDCGGDSDAILKSAVGICEYALLATTPNKPDVRRVAPTFKAALEAAQDADRAAEIDVSIVFVKVDNRREAYNTEVRKQTQERLPVLKAQVSSRPAVYSDAFGAGAPPAADLEEVHAIVKEMGAAA
jgi:chromosome partitioning protein